MTKERVLIVDGHNTFIRCWAVNPTLNQNGDPVGGVVGFIKSVKSVMRDAKPTLVVVVWDGEGGSQKRRGIYSEYKAGRKPRVNRSYDLDTVDESWANLDMQHAKVRQLIDMLGIVQVEVPAIEADDVIAFLCRFTFREVDKVIVSTDRDFLQLVDVHTLVYSPTKKVCWTAPLMKDELKILPENYIYVKAIVGDHSDNVKGIKGIGETTVLKMFPFLGTTRVSLEDIMVYAKQATEQPKPKMKGKFQAVLDSRDLIVSNMSLMQLTDPIIGAQSAAAIRYAAERKPSWSPTEFKLALMRDGIQMTDGDLFTAFTEYRARHEASLR